MSAAAIHLRGVTRRYGAALVLDDVTLSVRPGEVLVLLGASGSGKSTLLRLIAGLEPLDAGEIQIGDDRVSTPGFTLVPEQRRVGLVFQDYALFPHLSALDNVAFGLIGLDRDARTQAAHRWLDRVGLANRARAFPHELSGGEQQRVALARALCPRPRAVLLDEPFSGLDPALRAELRDMTLAAIAEANATAVFVTHDADEALAVADTLAILRGGRLVQAGPPRTLYKAPASPAAAAALGPVNRFEGRVEGGALETPFGALAAPAIVDGTLAVAIVRPEALRLSPQGTARVIDRRPQGAGDLVCIESDGVVWRAWALPEAGPTAGSLCGVEIGVQGAFVFAAEPARD